MDCYKRQPLRLKALMKLVSIPANPVPDNFVTGELKTPDGVTLRFARWLPPAGRKGTVVILQGRAEWIEKYFETVRDLRSRGFAVADARLARPGPVGAHARRSPQRLRPRLRRIRQRSRDLHARDRAAGLSAAVVRARPFHGRHRAHSRRLSRPPLVRSHGVGGADDRLARLPGDDDGESLVRALRIAGFGSMYVPRGEVGVMEAKPFVGNHSDVRSGALCAQSGGPRSGARAGARRADRRLGPTPRSAPCG